MRAHRDEPVPAAAGSLAPGGVVPLLDTLFLLLFCLLAMSETRRPDRAEEVRIRLPEVGANPDASAADAPTFTVEIDAESRVWNGRTGEPLADRRALDAQLGAALGDALPEELVVELLADRDARHGVAVEILQHLLSRGFRNVQLLADGSGDAIGPFGESSGGGGR